MYVVILSHKKTFKRLWWVDLTTFVFSESNRFLSCTRASAWFVCKCTIFGYTELLALVLNVIAEQLGCLVAARISDVSRGVVHFL